MVSAPACQQQLDRQKGSHLTKAARIFVPNGEMNDIPTYKPREARIRSIIPVVITDDVGRELDARIGNFSKGGFMAECEVKMPVDAIIQVEHPQRGLIKAKIRWSDGWRFGAMVITEA